METTFKKEFAQLLHVPVQNLTPDYNLTRNAEWDSFTIMYTIGLFDKFFQKKVNTNKLVTCKSYGDLLKLLGNEYVIKN
jgi:acyl carrier protein